MDPIPSTEQKLHKFCTQCKVSLSLDDTHKRCDKCRKRERERETAARRKAMESQEQTQGPITEKPCTVCTHVKPIEDFQGVKKGVITKTCKACRAQNKKGDANRDTEERLRQERERYHNNPQVKINKQKWNEDNPEKRIAIYNRHRQKRIETQGVQNYQKKNAEHGANWRKNNPEKVKQNNEKKRNSIQAQYQIYVRSAFIKNLEMSLSFEQYEALARQNCFYCNTMDPVKQFVGLDRINSNEGYTTNNCVPCCTMCNWMKGCLNPIIFIKRVEHVLTHLNMVQGQLQHLLFSDHSSSKTYNVYKYNSKQRNKVFTVTKEEFDVVLMESCYLCGKTNTATHRNGIDRFDNKEGYITGNIRSCCGECNFMKKKIEYPDFVEKLTEIYNNYLIMKQCEELVDFFNTVDEQELIRLSEQKIIQKSNKKSKEERKRINNAKKIVNQQKLKESYSDENIQKRTKKTLQIHLEKKQNNSCGEEQQMNNILNPEDETTDDNDDDNMSFCSSADGIEQDDDDFEQDDNEQKIYESND
jgi:hypothetical protein